jgi:hypothetical protein
MSSVIDASKLKKHYVEKWKCPRCKDVRHLDLKCKCGRGIYDYADDPNFTSYIFADEYDAINEEPPP